MSPRPVRHDQVTSAAQREHDRRHRAQQAITDRPRATSREANRAKRGQAPAKKASGR
jgi:hypothetical protein